MLKLHLPPGTSASVPCGFHGVHILVRGDRQYEQNSKQTISDSYSSMKKVK